MAMVVVRWSKEHVCLYMLFLLNGEQLMNTAFLETHYLSICEVKSTAYEI